MGRRPEIPVFYPGIPVGTAPAVFNAQIRDPFTALLDRPRFRARGITAFTVAESFHQYIPWDTPDEDNYVGWGGAAGGGQPARYTIPDGWGGFWQATAAVSLFGTGASGLVIIPSIAVNGQSQIGVSGGAGWEGQEVFTPLGASGIPKTVSSSWEVYASGGDYIQLDLWYSSESAITAVDITPGLQCRLELVWDGV